MENILFLREAIESVKTFENFQGALMTGSLHPEWLDEIPEGQKWAMVMTKKVEY